MAEINLGNDNELNIDLSPVETLTTSVPDINYIPGYKEAEEERRANETIRISNEETRQENETARQNYYTYIQGKVDNGDFDGVSPIVTTSKSGDTTTITIVDAEGTKTATILDGTAYYGVVSNKPTIDSVTDKIKIVATADEFTLEEGATIVINFNFSGTSTPLSNAGYQLNVNNTGFKNIYWGNTLTPSQGESTGFYKKGQTLSFVYDGSNYRAIDCRFGDTTTYGIVKLSDSTSLNDSGLAATSKAVKSAYDKATSVESSLSNYVLKTDYSTYSTAGVVKSGINGFQVDSSGNPKAFNGSYANYTAATNDLFIGKGTLENVITGKDLTTKSYVDDSVEPINDYVFGDESVSGEGTSIQITDTLKGKFKSVECKGQTSQTGTPTPSSPIPINVVSGDNYIDICGKNLFNSSNVILNREISSGVIAYSTNSNMYYMKVDVGTKYNFSRKSSANSGIIGFADEIPNTGVTTYDRSSLSNITSISKTATHKYLVLQLYQVEDLSETMVEVGSTKTTYEPYQGKSYPINLGDIELCKIGAYQDYIYKNNGKWYLHKEIGKYTFTGNETFTSQPYGTNSWLVNSIINTISNDNLNLCISNIFTGISKSERNNEVSNSIYANTTTALYIRNTNFTTQAQIRSATNGNYVYYILATPTNTEITDTTLLEQLESLSSEKGITNLSQTNNDLPMILDVEAFKNNLNGKLGLLDKLVEG